MLAAGHLQQQVRAPAVHPLRSSHVRRVARPRLTSYTSRTSAKAELIGLLDRIDDLKRHVDELESELAEASRVAEAAAKRSRRLAERTQQLQSYAVQHVYEGDEGPARAALQQKAAAADALAKANDRARLNCLLAAKLEQVIQLKEQELIDLVRAAKRALEAQEAAVTPGAATAAPPPTAESSSEAARLLQRSDSSSSSSNSSRGWSSPTLHTMGSLDAAEGDMDDLQLVDIQWLGNAAATTMPRSIASSSNGGSNEGSKGFGSGGNSAGQAPDMQASSHNSSSSSMHTGEKAPLPVTAAENALVVADQGAHPTPDPSDRPVRAVLCWDGFKQVAVHHRQGSVSGSKSSAEQGGGGSVLRQGAVASAAGIQIGMQPGVEQGVGRTDEGAAAEAAGLSGDLQRVEALLARLDGSGYQLEDDGELCAVLLRLQQQLRA